MQYLKTRAKRQVILPNFTNPATKGGQGKAKRTKVQKPNQRQWTYLQEQATGLVSPAQYQPKGKGKGKIGNKGKPKGKGKGKPYPKGTTKGKPKGKGKVPGKGKGPMQSKGNTAPTMSLFRLKQENPAMGI